MPGSKLGKKLGKGMVGKKSMGSQPKMKGYQVMQMPKMKATASRVKLKNAGKRKG